MIASVPSLPLFQMVCGESPPNSDRRGRLAVGDCALPRQLLSECLRWGGCAQGAWATHSEKFESLCSDCRQLGTNSCEQKRGRCPALWRLGQSGKMMREQKNVILKLKRKLSSVKLMYRWVLGKKDIARMLQRTPVKIKFKYIHRNLLSLCEKVVCDSYIQLRWY